MYLKVLWWLAGLTAFPCIIANAIGGCKTMEFPVEYNFAGKSLAGFTFNTTRAENEEFCRAQCYMDDRCISYNYIPDEQTCELSESNHVIHPENVTVKEGTIYGAAKTTCLCGKNEICRYNFVESTHLCSCREGFSCSHAVQQSSNSLTQASQPLNLMSTQATQPTATESSLAAASTQGTQVSTAGSNQATTLLTTASTEVIQATTSTPTTSTTTAPTTSTTTSETTQATQPLIILPTQTTNSMVPIPTQTTQPLTIAPTQASQPAVSSSTSITGPEMLIFPRKSTEDKVLVYKPNLSLTAFTVALWFQVVSNGTGHTPFQYNVDTVRVNEISLLFYDVKTLLLLGIENINVPALILTDGYWHHVCLTWENGKGEYRIYVNGSLYTKDVKNRGRKIENGAILLGQEADNYIGSFESHQSFQGNMTNFNMWDKALSTTEVADLALSCNATVEGNVQNWEDILKVNPDGQVMKAPLTTNCK